jgi:hypothetical protein
MSINDFSYIFKEFEIIFKFVDIEMYRFRFTKLMVKNGYSFLLNNT